MNKMKIKKFIRISKKLIDLLRCIPVLPLIGQSIFSQ